MGQKTRKIATAWKLGANVFCSSTMNCTTPAVSAPSPPVERVAAFTKTQLRTGKANRKLTTWRTH